LGLATSVGSLVAFDAFGNEGSGYVSLAVVAVACIQIGIAWVLIERVMGTTYGRAILVWVLYTGTSVAMSYGLVFALKAFVVNAYVVPTNSNAPTIIGWHRVAKCPHCQGHLIVPGRDPMEPLFPGAPDIVEELSICATCRKPSKFRPERSPQLGPDRILVSLLAKPARWDIIAFRYPPDPSRIYVARLVGLPGEKVHIKNGGIWIDGVRVEPPSELARLEYLPVTHEFGGPNLGTEENPFQLGASECCVLGDFPERSSDSRDWGPVPVENIEGVVCVTYWPVGRLRIFK
jgi:signal peptidase I